ncbi:MAG: thioredoxin family protein [Actinomycetota bacterium]|nr:thioredoxin family protein [Actinomycetota bacterium]
MSEEETPQSGTRAKATVLIIVAVVFAVLLGTKLGGSLRSTADAPTVAGGAAVEQVSGDVVSAYEEAVASGKPVFLSFGKETCPNCIEMKKVADKVVPDYEGRVVYIKADVDEPSSQQLASRFSFQYIPTSFFLAPDGSVIDSYTGKLDEEQMRTYLDALVAGQ